ncbi:MAG: toll/interleukin-1 receptor domain-containing protein [Pseudomonadota bacterium]
MADIFISYSRQDQEIVEALKDLLESEGFTVWWDAKLYSGVKFEAEIERQLHESAAVIVLWSRYSIDSKFVQAEARVAYEGDRLLPLATEPIDITSIPFTMRDVHIERIDQWVETQNPDDARDALKAVRQMVQLNSQTPATERTDATVEFVFFQAIALSENVKDWKNYLERFPTGQFRDIARNKIKALSDRRRKPKRTDDREERRGGGLVAAINAAVLVALLGIGGALATGPMGLGYWTMPERSDVGTSFEDKRAALIEASLAFNGRGFSDDDARAAIKAANALTDLEIESDETLVTTLESIMDSFFSASRFDFAARVEEVHGDLFKRHAEFYVSFCLSYGRRLLASRPVSARQLWSLDDEEQFERDLAKYYEYAKLDIVRQRFPEYEVLYEPAILKLQGAPEGRVISRVARAEVLEDIDLQNFQRELEAYATGSFTINPDDPEASTIRARVRDLIAEYASYDPSGSWREVGVRANIDMTRDDLKPLDGVSALIADSVDPDAAN